MLHLKGQLQQNLWRILSLSYPKNLCLGNKASLKSRKFTNSKLAHIDVRQVYGGYTVPGKDYSKLNKALSSQKYFKRKKIKRRQPYTTQSNLSTHTRQGGARNRSELGRGYGTPYQNSNLGK